MRGKLEQSRAQIELISVEVERIDVEFNDLWLSYEFTCPGGEYKSALALPIQNSRDMANQFFRELLEEAQHLSQMEGDESSGVNLYVVNKATTMLPIKNLCQRVIEVMNSEDQPEEDARFIDICTTGFNFKDPNHSLENKSFEERFKDFMSRARQKMDHDYFTIAADDLEKAKILCSTSPLIYKLIGICHRELGHLELACEMFSRSKELGDNDTDTFLYLAEVNFFLGDMPSALAILEEMSAQYPGDVRAMVEKANVLYQMNRDYVPILDQAYEQDMEETRTIILQTFVFKREGNSEQKHISLEQASREIGIPLATMTALAHKQRIPIRHVSGPDEITLDEHELKNWSYVYRRYGLLQDEVDRITHSSREETDPGLALLP